MSTSGVSITVTGLNTVSKRLRGMSRGSRKAIDFIARRATLDFEELASNECPSKSGRLKASLSPRPFKPGDRAFRKIAFAQYQIGSRVPYATDVEFGTAPHQIYPKNKNALWWEGAQHPVFMVNHPGARAQPFMGPAIMRSKSRLINPAREHLRRFLSQYTR